MNYAQGQLYLLSQGRKVTCIEFPTGLRIPKVFKIEYGMFLVMTAEIESGNFIV
jgi:hypothetical protein